MEKELIRLENICKIYGHGETAVQALYDINLSVREGEFLAIIGPSGSGKSTLMHLLGLLDRPTGGRYFFKGKEVSKFSDRELARFRGREIGFVFQAFNLLPRVSAQKNVELPMIYQGIRPKVRKEKALKILSGLGIGDRVKHKPTELSGGEQQRVALARALANDAPIILADEPTGNLDSVRTKEIMQILKKLNREGKTIIMVTHEPELVEYAQRLVSMKDGKIVSDQKVTKKLVANLKQLVLRR